MRALALAVAAASLLTPGWQATGMDATISDSVARIFADRPDSNFVSIVVKDEARSQYLGFYLATYLDLKELRVYVVPFQSADVEAIDAALAAGDHATAFASLLENMRVTLGAKYVSDVNLDGIRDQELPLGNGTIRDNFHRELFATYADADKAYREWLRRGLELIEH